MILFTNITQFEKELSTQSITQNNSTLSLKYKIQDQSSSSSELTKPLEKCKNNLIVEIDFIKNLLKYSIQNSQTTLKNSPQLISELLKTSITWIQEPRDIFESIYQIKTPNTAEGSSSTLSLLDHLTIESMCLENSIDQSLQNRYKKISSPKLYANQKEIFQQFEYFFLQEPILNQDLKYIKPSKAEQLGCIVPKRRKQKLENRILQNNNFILDLDVHQVNQKNIDLNQFFQSLEKFNRFKTTFNMLTFDILEELYQLPEQTNEAVYLARKPSLQKYFKFFDVDNFYIWEEFIENYESVRVFKLDLKNQKRTDYKSFQSFTDNTSTELHNKETQEIKTQKNTEPNSQIDINYQNIVISNSELPMDEPLTREEMVEAIKEDIKTTKKIVTNIITELKDDTLPRLTKNIKSDISNIFEPFTPKNEDTTPPIQRRLDHQKTAFKETYNATVRAHKGDKKKLIKIKAHQNKRPQHLNEIQILFPNLQTLVELKEYSLPNEKVFENYIVKKTNLDEIYSFRKTSKNLKKNQTDFILLPTKQYVEEPQAIFEKKINTINNELFIFNFITQNPFDKNYYTIYSETYHNSLLPVKFKKDQSIGYCFPHAKSRKDLHKLWEQLKTLYPELKELSTPLVRRISLEEYYKITNKFKNSNQYVVGWNINNLVQKVIDIETIFYPEFSNIELIS